MSSGLINCKVDDVDDEELSEFIQEGTHYNGTVDFQDVEGAKVEVLNHADMEKAYVNFFRCKWYQGFLGKITDFRKTDKVVGVGLYRITDLVIPEGPLKVYNTKLGGVYVNRNVYPSAELQMLSELGATFRVTAGCWGVKPLDFRFPSAMLDEDDEGIKHYAKWTGGCDQHNRENCMWMKGNRDFFDSLKHYCGEQIV